MYRQSLTNQHVSNSLLRWKVMDFEKFYSLDSDDDTTYPVLNHSMANPKPKPDLDPNVEYDVKVFLDEGDDPSGLIPKKDKSVVLKPEKPAEPQASGSEKSNPKGANRVGTDREKSVKPYTPKGLQNRNPTLTMLVPQSNPSKVLTLIRVLLPWVRPLRCEEERWWKECEATKKGSSGEKLLGYARVIINNYMARHTWTSIRWLSRTCSVDYSRGVLRWALKFQGITSLSTNHAIEKGTSIGEDSFRDFLGLETAAFFSDRFGVQILMWVLLAVDGLRASGSPLRVNVGPSLVAPLENKLIHLEEALPEAPPATASATIRTAYTKRFNEQQEVAALMLVSMTPEIQKNLEELTAFEMLRELKTMIQQQAEQELFEIVKAFHACKQEDGQSVSSYVLKMKGYLDQMERLGYPMPQVLGVSLILTSLSKDYDQFVMNYNMHSMGKTIAELHAMLKLAEQGLPKKAPVVLAIKEGRIQKPQSKGKGPGKGKGKQVSKPKPKIPPPAKKEHPAKDATCHHCGVVGHWRRNCPTYLAELKKNKATQASVSSIFTIELYTFPNKSWVYDTGCGTHICNNVQGLRGSRKLKKGALDLYVGNGMRAAVEAIGSFDLILPNGLTIVLDNCHYAPTITRGIVSLSRLRDNGFIHAFTDYGISVSKDNMFYFDAIPRDGIFEIDMHNLVSNSSSMYSCRTKKSKNNMDSTYLWHCRLCHINKKRILKLQHDGLIESIDDESFDKCLSCISGKMTRKPFSHVGERARDLLGLIHTDVCGPFRTVSREGATYFITFTDDFSRYGYVYLLKHKHEAFETFKVFQSEVENQLGKTIKALRSDRGGEYMSQEFLDHLTKCGIVSQFTPPYTPQHNGVSERRNRTLLDMVRSMMSLTTLPLSFWGCALESAACVLNMVPTKKVDKTPYEIWHGKVPNLSYLKVWGCEARVKRDTPNKLEPRSIKCIFVGYPKKTMGYYFYYPPENKIFVARYAEFLENRLILQEASGSTIDFDEIQSEDAQPSSNTSEHHTEVEHTDVEPQNDVIPFVDLQGHLMHLIDMAITSMLRNKMWGIMENPLTIKLQCQIQNPISGLKQ
ncbi:hypothetical protein OSB04_006590 [Centaurea solstitialis]|uniref:Retrotransposon protein, putative, Ty1-copia subclass n=1 Tax=Centaurea solstitialis TaxID=347529 RepID=A0AA38TUW8_9ASTR|nr:hypothetical protein OSB04_006590 [Centaurea solstitialis]